MTLAPARWMLILCCTAIALALFRCVVDAEPMPATARVEGPDTASDTGFCVACDPRPVRPE